MTDQDKKQKLGAAVMQLGAELRAEGKPIASHALVDAFARLPDASISRLHDLLIPQRAVKGNPLDTDENIGSLP